MVQIDEERILRFWDWFRASSKNLRPEVLTNSTISELESELTKLGTFGWEIGPGCERVNMFAISPCRDSLLLEATRRIVKKAPPLTDWEFHPAKPPRRWKLRFELESGQMVNGTRWEVLTSQSRGLFEILLHPNDDCGLDLDHQELAASILVEGELGEEKLIEKVNTIQIVKNWTEAQQRSVRLLELGLLARAIC